MPKESLYNITKTRNIEIKNKGYDYKDKLFERTMSNQLFNGDTKREGILKEMEKVVVEMIESVKRIKTFINYTVPKDYRDFN